MHKTDHVKRMNKDELEALLNEHGSVQSVVHFVCSKNNEGVRKIIADRIRNEHIKWSPLRTKNRFRYTPTQVKQAFAEAECWSDIYRSLGLSICNHNKRSITRFAEHHNIPIPLFDEDAIKKTYRRNKHNVWIKEDIFVVDSKYARSNLRQAAIRFEIAVYECNECGCGPIHNNKELTLELDHINGVHTDNRIPNLRWLCPNCHSQTQTYKGKNR